LLIPSRLAERAHVVHPIGQLHENHANVVDHREEHLAKILGLPLLGGRKRNRADLGDALDDVGHLRTEQLVNPFDGRQRIFDDVVQQAGRNGHGIELEVDEELGDGQGVNKVGLARMAHLAPVFEGRKDVGAPEQLDVGVRAIGADLFQEILKPNHQSWCLFTGEASLTVVGSTPPS
jgi:hypothetical protein